MKVILCNVSATMIFTYVCFLRIDIFEGDTPPNSEKRIFQTPRFSFNAEVVDGQEVKSGYSRDGRGQVA